MHCKGAIKNGEPRVGFRQNTSQWYEGIMTRWLHLPCALGGAQGGVQRIGQLEGWDRVGYDCSAEIRTATGELLPQEAEAALQARMEGLEGLQDLLLTSLSKAEMVGSLALNGVDAASLHLGLNTVDMACLLSDGIAHGLAADCPACGNASVVECHGRLRCWGYLQGMTKCAYQTGLSDCARFQFRMPLALQDAAWLRAWRVQWAAAGGHGGGNTYGGGNGDALNVAAAEPPTAVIAVQAEAAGLTPAALKKALKARGLSPVGKKATLVKRLAAALVQETTKAPAGAEGMQKDAPAAQVAVPVATPAAAAAPAPAPSDYFCDGLSLTALKTQRPAAPPSSSSSLSFSSSSAAGAAVAVEMVLPPQAGSAILDVHEGYHQTGRSFYRAKVCVDPADGVTVYNAHFVEVNLRRGINRFYVVQLLQVVTGSFEVFCHWGKVGVPW
jgi:hypothetical protein